MYVLLGMEAVVIGGSIHGPNIYFYNQFPLVSCQEFSKVSSDNFLCFFRQALNTRYLINKSFNQWLC